MDIIGGEGGDGERIYHLNKVKYCFIFWDNVFSDTTYYYGAEGVFSSLNILLF